jgi:hypothetical protein
MPQTLTGIETTGMVCRVTLRSVTDTALVASFASGATPGEPLKRYRVIPPAARGSSTTTAVFPERIAAQAS